MERIASGDQYAMEELIELWKMPMFRFFLRSLNHHEDAEDLTQRVFIRIYRSADRYLPQAKFSTWIFTIARNLLIDEIKKRKRRPQMVFDEFIERAGEVEGSRSTELTEILMKQLDYDTREPQDRLASEGTSANSVTAKLPMSCSLPKRA